MKALIRILCCVALIAVFGCGGKSSPSLTNPTTNVAFLFAVGQGANSIQGFDIEASGNLLTSAVGSFATNPRPVAIALHPSTNFVYVANLTSNTVSGYRVDHTAGFLDPVGEALAPNPTGPSPVALGVDSSGRFLFVLNQGDASISVYSVDPARGILTQTGPAFSTHLTTTPQAMLVSPVAPFLYVLSTSTGNPNVNIISVFSIASNGSLAAAPGAFTAPASNSTIAGITTDPKGQFMYAADSANNDVISLSIASSGALAEVAGSPFAAGTQPVAVAVNGTGTFVYVSNAGSNNVSAFKSAAGVLSEVSGSPFSTQGSGTVAVTQPGFLTVDATNTFLYVSNVATKAIAGFAINAADGSLVPITGSPFSSGTVVPLGMVSTTSNVSTQ
ncbi:MAG TPA: beta-propeller fold lactonase family protein [Candidatus Angelobacter sp.]|nr:beta-propeller fold lactonase family protein [Candidatus Angelobacter sp.]